jgi:hypothetical protein
VFIVQAYQTSMRGGIFLGKRRSDSLEVVDGKINVQSACALNTQYNDIALSMTT